MTQWPVLASLTPDERACICCAAAGSPHEEFGTDPIVLTQYDLALVAGTSRLAY